MSKRKSKATKTSKTKTFTKASAAKTAVTKSSADPTAALIVLGYDDQQKPRGARFVDAKPNLVTKAADLMDLKVYQATSEDVAAIAEKLPLGRLYANGRGFVPNVRQDLYSDLIVALAVEPEAALSPETDKDTLPAARGLPRTWDEVGPGAPMFRQLAFVARHRAALRAFGHGVRRWVRAVCEMFNGHVARVPSLSEIRCLETRTGRKLVTETAKSH